MKNLLNIGERCPDFYVSVFGIPDNRHTTRAQVRWRTRGHDPIVTEKVTIELGRGNSTVDLSGSILKPFRSYKFQTLHPVPGAGYMVDSDHMTARYLPGRNVVIVESADKTTAGVIQMAEWPAIWLELVLTEKLAPRGEMAADMIVSWSRWGANGRLVLIKA